MTIKCRGNHVYWHFLPPMRKAIIIIGLAMKMSLTPRLIAFITTRTVGKWQCVIFVPTHQTLLDDEKCSHSLTFPSNISDHGPNSLFWQTGLFIHVQYCILIVFDPFDSLLSGLPAWWVRTCWGATRRGTGMPLTWPTLWTIAPWLTSS